MALRRDCLDGLRESSPAVLPSLLLCDFGNLEREINQLEEAGVAALHLDVMDGVFVPNFTYGMTIVHAIRQLTELPLDVHLMMVNPEKYVPQFFEAGADIITIHAEATEDAAKLVDKIKSLGAAAGVAVNPGTPVSAMESALPNADLALVMSVNAGFGGQSFMPEVLPKFEEIRAIAGTNVLLEIDGGINVDTIAQATNAGAELLVAGSAIFKQPDYAGAMQQLMAEVSC